MPAGGPLDHPLSDILTHGLNVYTPECDRMIRELNKIVSRKELFEMFDWLDDLSASESDKLEFEKKVRIKYLMLKGK
ncbi:hypothetical protein PY092_11585 [Muricauda sp. 334s03]|uniref:Uncharacterized protein n=1 Tax=Flagellimonas yonaguniensis TaxID=3031325 RepID=A0ABT5Y022_9FLAO|nr:hypothetical protein [[Muricauda] yonaguniensis]MDF0716795.1 hypothetical protein [[Muricauda] yonaguniensis]